MDALNLTIKLKNLHCYDEGDGPGSAEPYLWTVFFKVDGDTATVTERLTLQGTATVVGTAGNHGDLSNKDVDDGENAGIPASLGEYHSVLRPIPLQKPLLGITSVSGVAGVLTVLMEEDKTPNSAIAKGHAALNRAVQQGINSLIPSLNLSHQQPTDADINKIKGQVGDAVIKAIKNEVSVFEWLGGLGNMDDQIGSQVFMFSHKDLAAAGGAGLPIKQRWKVEGDWELTGQATATSLPR